MLQLPASTYADRRRRLLDQLPPGGAMLLPTHGEITRSNTTAFPFRPNSDFYYVSGFPEPDAWLLLKRDGEEPGFHLFVLPRDRERETWTGRRHGVDGAKERFGADHAERSRVAALGDAAHQDPRGAGGDAHGGGDLADKEHTP